MAKLSSVLTAIIAAAVTIGTDASTKVSHQCDRNINGYKIIQAQSLTIVEKSDFLWCWKHCMETDGCEAVNFRQVDGVGKCQLLDLSPESMLMKVEGERSRILCRKCNTKVQGTKIVNGRQIQSKIVGNSQQCKSSCNRKNKCNGYNLKKAGNRKRCFLLEVDFADHTLVSDNSFLHSWKNCRRMESIPECGTRDGPLCPVEPNCQEGLIPAQDDNEVAYCTCGVDWRECCPDHLGRECKEDNRICAKQNENDDEKCLPCGGPYEKCCVDDDGKASCASDRYNCEDSETDVEGLCKPCGEANMSQNPCDASPHCVGDAQLNEEQDECVIPTNPNVW